MIPYWIIQLGGAALAVLVIWAADSHQAYQITHLEALSPSNGASAMQVLLVEVLIAFILVFTVIATTTDPWVPAGVAIVAIGFSLAAGVLLGGAVSGGSGIPARALAPTLVFGTASVWFFYTVGPLLGAVAAAGAVNLIWAAHKPLDQGQPVTPRVI